MTELPVAAISILQALKVLADRDPTRAILVDGDRVVTRAEFDASTNRLARVFADRGVKRGDFVSIILPNSIAFLESVAAAWKLGAIPQPLPPKLAAKELHEILALANPKLIVGNLPGRPAGRKISSRSILPEGFVPDAAISVAPLPDIVAPHFKAMVSGGSTGRPKIIVAGNPGTIDLDAPCPTIQPNESMLVTGPLYHNAPFFAVTTSLLSGGCAVLTQRFDAEETLRLVEKHRINFMTLVPTMMHRIWRLGADVRARYDISSLRSVVHSAAPCPVWLKDAWIEWIGADRLVEAYSNTEAPGYTIITGREWLKKRGSVGKVDPRACEIKIAGPGGQALPPNTVGEIYMRPAQGPDSNYFYGERYFYIGAQAKRIEGGWDSMGDLGYLDEDGYLFLCDRRADIILRGGANIYPAEIEAALESHPAVRTSAVVGVPDEDLGETVLAIVDADRAVSEAELRRHLQTCLSAYKMPARFEFVGETLRNDAGKVCRTKLRASRVPMIPAPVVIHAAA